MRFRQRRPLALAGAFLLPLALGACNVGRNVADDCWIDRGALESANRFRLGLKARNVPADDGAWAIAHERVTRASQDLRACEDGAPGSGRPSVESLSSGHGAGGSGHGSAEAPHGA